MANLQDLYLLLSQEPRISEPSTYAEFEERMQDPEYNEHISNLAKWAGHDVSGYEGVKKKEDFTEGLSPQLEQGLEPQNQITEGIQGASIDQSATQAELPSFLSAPKTMEMPSAPTSIYGQAPQQEEEIDTTTSLDPQNPNNPYDLGTFFHPSVNAIETGRKTRKNFQDKYSFDINASIDGANNFIKEENDMAKDMGIEQEDAPLSEVEDVQEDVAVFDEGGKKRKKKKEKEAEGGLPTEFKIKEYEDPFPGVQIIGVHTIDQTDKKGRQKYQYIIQDTSSGSDKVTSKPKLMEGVVNDKVWKHIISQKRDTVFYEDDSMWQDLNQAVITVNGYEDQEKPDFQNNLKRHRIKYANELGFKYNDQTGDLELQNPEFQYETGASKSATEDIISISPKEEEVSKSRFGKALDWVKGKAKDVVGSVVGYVEKETAKNKIERNLTGQTRKFNDSDSNLRSDAMELISNTRYVENIDSDFQRNLEVGSDIKSAADVLNLNVKDIMLTPEKDLAERIKQSGYLNTYFKPRVTEAIEGGTAVAAVNVQEQEIDPLVDPERYQARLQELYDQEAKRLAKELQRSARYVLADRYIDFQIENKVSSFKLEDKDRLKKIYNSRLDEMNPFLYETENRYGEEGTIGWNEKAKKSNNYLINKSDAEFAGTIYNNSYNDFLNRPQAQAFIAGDNLSVSGVESDGESLKIRAEYLNNRLNKEKQNSGISDDKEVKSAISKVGEIKKTLSDLEKRINEKNEKLKTLIVEEDGNQYYIDEASQQEGEKLLSEITALTNEYNKVYEGINEPSSVLSRYNKYVGNAGNLYKELENINSRLNALSEDPNIVKLQELQQTLDAVDYLDWHKKNVDGSLDRDGNINIETLKIKAQNGDISNFDAIHIINEAESKYYKEKAENETFWDWMTVPLIADKLYRASGASGAGFFSTIKRVSGAVESIISYPSAALGYDVEENWINEDENKWTLVDVEKDWLEGITRSMSQEVVNPAYEKYSGSWWASNVLMLTPDLVGAAGGGIGAVKTGLQSGFAAGLKNLATSPTTAYFTARSAGNYAEEAEAAGYSPAAALAFGGGIAYVVAAMESLFPEIPTFQRVTLKRMANQIIAQGLKEGLKLSEIAGKISAGTLRVTGKSLVNILSHAAKEGFIEEGSQFIAEEAAMAGLGAREIEIIDPKTGEFGRTAKEYFDNVAIGGFVGGIMGGASTISSIFNEKLRGLNQTQTILAIGQDYDAILEKVLSEKKDFKETNSYKEMQQIKSEYDKLAANEIYNKYDDIAKGAILNASVKLESLLKSQSDFRKKGIVNLSLDNQILSKQKELNSLLESADERLAQRTELNEKLNSLGVHTFFLNPDGSAKNVIYNESMDKEMMEKNLPEVVKAINDTYKLNPTEDAVQKSETGEVPVQSEAAVSEQMEEGKSQTEPQVTTEKIGEEEITSILEKEFEKDPTILDSLRKMSEPSGVMSGGGMPYIRYSDGSYGNSTDGPYKNLDELKRTLEENSSDPELYPLPKEKEQEMRNDESEIEIEQRIANTKFNDDLDVWNYLNNEGLKRLGYNSPMEMSDEDRQILAYIVSKGVDEYNKNSALTVFQANKILNNNLASSIAKSYLNMKNNGDESEFIKTVDGILNAQVNQGGINLEDVKSRRELPNRDSNWDKAAKENLPESSYASIEEFKDVISNGEWGMLTAENPMRQQLSDEENAQRNEEAKAWLEERGYTPQMIFGKYDNSENSFFVPNLTKKDAIEFAKKFNQESVATNSGMVYQDGTYNPIKKGNETFGEKDNYYSTINIKGNRLSFSVDYDWDNTLSSDEEVGFENISDIDTGVRLTDADAILDLANQTGFNMSDRGRSNELSNKTKDGKKSKIIDQAKRAVNTLKSLLPNFEVVVFDNELDYKDYARSINANPNSKGLFTTLGGGKGVIAINLQSANLRTVAHELGHAALFKIFGENPVLFKEFKGKIADLAKGKKLKAVRESGEEFEISLDEIAEDLASDKSYEDVERAEEYMSELTAALAQLNASDPSTNSFLKSIAEFINKFIARYFGTSIKAIDNTSSPEEIMDFFQTLASTINVGGKVKYDGKTKESNNTFNKSQVEKLFKQKTPVFKSLIEISNYIENWVNENKLFDDNIENVSDKEVVKKFSDHILKEINAWSSMRGSEYIGFYDQDIPDRLNPELQKFAKERYGRELTNEEISLYHIVSAFASPSADPEFDSSKGLEVFDKYMTTGKLSGYTDEQATIWERDTKGKEYDTGKPKFDEQGNVVYKRIAKAYAVDSLGKFNKVLEYFNNDIAKAVNWVLSKHTYEEVSNVVGTPIKGEKAIKENEYFDKKNGGMGVFGITGVKLGSYILNRVGDYSTVTKDMWYARTLARLAGESLSEKGKALASPWALTKAGLRKRKLADEAFAIVAKKLNSSPADVQQKIWDFEKRLYEKLGSIEKASYASDGFKKKAKELSANQVNIKSKSQADKSLVEKANLSKEMTEDDQGNYLFYHYSPNKISSIDPKYFGKNTSRTGKDERPGLNISMYYTRPDVLDVSGKYGYVVRIPKDKVYPFNQDPLNLYDKAKSEFEKMYPGQTFDPNKQAAFISREASKLGFPMTVVQWGNNLRAETTEKMNGEFYMRPDKEYPSAVEYNPELEVFEANEILEEKNKNIPKSKSQIIGTTGASRLKNGKKLMHDLDIARMMEAENRSKEDIRLQTNWERGADGYWRIEAPYGKLKIIASNEELAKIRKEFSTKIANEALGSGFKSLPEYIASRLKYVSLIESGVDKVFKGKFDNPKKPTVYRSKLTDIFDAPELFKAYGSKEDWYQTEYSKESGRIYGYGIKDIIVEFDPDYPSGDASMSNLFVNLKPVLTVSAADVLRLDNLLPSIIHELQHYVQMREFFENGGDPRTVFHDISYTLDNLKEELQDKEQALYNIKQWTKDAKQIELREKSVDIVKKKINDLLNAIEKSNIEVGDKESLKTLTSTSQNAYYKNLSGETEARNAAKRSLMTDDERRNKTLESTEDVAREDQILLETTFIKSKAQAGKSNVKKSDLSKDDIILLETAIEEAVGKVKSGSGLQFILNNLVDQIRKLKSVRDKSPFRKKEIEQDVKNEVVQIVSREIAGNAKSYMDTRNINKNEAIDLALSDATKSGIEFSTADEIKSEVKKQLDNIIKNTQKQERSSQQEITLTTTEKQALKDQIKKMASDVKKVVTDMKKQFSEKMKKEKEMRGFVSSWVKEYLKSSGISDKLTPTQMRAIINRALSLSMTMTDKQLNNFIEYVDRIASNQKIADKMAELSSNRKEGLKRKHNQYTQQVKKFLTIPLFDTDGKMIFTEQEMSDYFDIVDMLNQNIPDHSMLDMTLADKAINAYNEVPEDVSEDDFLDKLQEISDVDITDLDSYRQFVSLINSASNIVKSLYNKGIIDEAKRSDMLSQLYMMEDGIRIYDANHQDQIDNIKMELISNIEDKLKNVSKDGLVGDQKNLLTRFETLMSTSKSEGLMKLDVKDLLKLDEILDRLEYGFLAESDFRDVVNKAEVRYRQMGKAITTQLQGLYGKMKQIVTNLMKRRLYTEEAFQWEKVLGVGQDSSIYKYLIDPIDRAVRKMNKYTRDNIDKYYNEKQKIRKPGSRFMSFIPAKTLVNKAVKIFGKDVLRYTAKVKTSTFLDTRVGVLSHILDSGHKATFFNQKSNDWLGKQLNDPAVRAEYGSDVYILDKIYADLMSNPLFVTDGKLDYAKIYESYVNDPSSVFSDYENSVYDLFRSNVQSSGELIVNANAIRGINGELNPFHSPRRYVGNFKNSEEADLLKGSFGKYGSIRSGSSYTRVLIDPEGPLNFNIDQIVAEQITEAARDYYLNDAISFTNAVFRNAMENAKSPAERAAISAIKDANRKRVDFELSRPEGQNILTRAYNNLSSAFSKKVLLPPKRLVTELITNITSGALRQKTLKGFSPVSMIKAKKIMEKFDSPVADMGWRFKTYASMSGGKLNRKSTLGYIENITSSALNIAGPTVFGEWMANFERHFYELTGERYNEEKHLDNPEYQYFLEESSAYANRQIGKIRGGSLKGQTRMKYKVVPEIFFLPDAVSGQLDESKGTVDPNSFLGPIVNFFNNFVYRDVTNFFYGAKETAVGAVRLDSKKFADGIGSVFGSSYSLSIYPILGFILNQLWNLKFGDDEEKEKAGKNLEMFESKEQMTEFLSQIFTNLAMTLGTSKFGVSGRAISIGVLQYMRNDPSFDQAVIDEYLKTFYYVNGVDIMRSNAAEEMVADLVGIISPPISDLAKEAVYLTQDLISEPKYNRATIADIWEEGGKFSNDQDVVDYKKLISALVMTANFGLAIKGENLPMSRALVNTLKDYSEKEQDIVIMSADGKYNLVAGVLDFEDGKGRLVVQGETKDETEVLSNKATELFINLVNENKSEFTELENIRKRGNASKEEIREADAFAYSLLQYLADQAKYEAKIEFNIQAKEPNYPLKDDMSDEEMGKAFNKIDSTYQDAVSKGKFSENFKRDMLRKEREEFIANPPSTDFNGINLRDIKEAYGKISSQDIGLQRKVRQYLDDVFDYNQGYMMEKPDYSDYFSYNKSKKEITE